MHEHVGYLRTITSLPELTTELSAPTKDQCVIVFWRHFPHNHNRTIRKWLRLAYDIGRTLNGLGVKVAAAYASPEPRAQQHLMACMEGMGQMVQLKTDDRLGALSNEPRKTVEFLKDRAAAANTNLETMFFNDPELVDLRSRRGQDGASCLLDIATRHCGDIILVGSHGASLLEPTIAALANREQNKYPHQMGAGGMAILLLNCHTGDLLDETYVEFDPALTKGY